MKVSTNEIRKKKKNAMKPFESRVMSEVCAAYVLNEFYAMTSNKCRVRQHDIDTINFTRFNVCSNGLLDFCLLQMLFPLAYILQVSSALDAPDGLFYNLNPASDFIHFVPGARGLRLDLAQQETAEDANVFVVVLSKGRRSRSDGRCG